MWYKSLSPLLLPSSPHQGTTAGGFGFSFLGYSIIDTHQGFAMSAWKVLTLGSYVVRLHTHTHAPPPFTGADGTLQAVGANASPANQHRPLHAPFPA